MEMSFLGSLNGSFTNSYLFSLHTRSLFPLRPEWHGLRHRWRHIHKCEQFKNSNEANFHVSNVREMWGRPREHEEERSCMFYCKRTSHHAVIHWMVLTQTMPLDLMCVQDHSVPAEWHWGYRVEWQVGMLSLDWRSKPLCCQTSVLLKSPTARHWVTTSFRGTAV